jgi:hypothetical protein
MRLVEAGNLMIVGYHGTSAAFDAFDLAVDPVNRFNPITGMTDIEGLFFSGDPHTAYSYAAMAKRKTGGQGRMRVIKAQLDMQHPFDITQAIKRGQRKGLSFGDAKRAALAALDRSQHDGVIFQGNAQNPPEYIVFSPHQVKLVEGVSSSSRIYGFSALWSD